MKTAIELRETDFSIDTELEKFESKKFGAVVMFLGRVRDISRAKKVRYLELDAYTDMALETLTKLKKRAETKFKVDEILVIHRIGKLYPGDNIVLIMVGAEHRKPAFRACEFLINELKKSVPIWKKEVIGSGSRWVKDD